MPNKMMRTNTARTILAKELTQTQFTAESRANVMNAIATIKENLPFLVDLTAEQRKGLLKMGDGSRGFVSKAQELVQQSSDFLPRSFDVEQMLRNAELWQEMKGMLLAMNQLQELMDDTYVALGSQAYSDALAVYQYAKAVSHTGTLEQSVVEMGKRFVKKGEKKKGAEETGDGAVLGSAIA
jgi:hypothetical protein